MHRISSLSSALTISEMRVRTQGERVEVEKWHGVPTEGKPDLVSIEVLDVVWSAPMVPGQSPGNSARTMVSLAQQCQPNLPWADNHFAERVSREPLNPGEQFKNWPWYTLGSNWDEHFRDSPTGKFTHTYMERFWPKHAPDDGVHTNEGIHYRYGDLDDVVNLLIHEPLTRQAWLPVWFPEDTGVVHGGRVPCTLGYQFMLRDNKLHLWYIIRSCDVVRYLRDDVYMACRLALWVLDECVRKQQEDESESRPGEFLWEDITLGDLHFHAFSLHMFEGDRYVSRP